MKEVFFLSLVLFQLILAKENFKLNFNSVSDEYVDYINHQNLSWKAKRYSDETLSTRDFGKLFGVLSDHKLKARRLGYRPQQSNDTDEMPEYFDAREKWNRCQSINMIRDQSICGSCWAFAAVEVMSDRICIHSNQQKQTLVSSENLIGCCKRCGDGCKGGYPNAAWVHWYSEGIVTGGEYKRYDQGCQPYSVEPCYSGNRSHPFGGSCKKKVAITPSCRAVCDNKTQMDYGASLTFGQKPYALAAIESDIQLEIMTNGPVQASFDVYQEFTTFNKGVYQRSKNPGKFMSPHSVKLIGWGVDKSSGVPYWLAANSWGKMWGENGYFRIIRGINHCGIEDAVLAGLPLEAVGMSNTECLQSYLKKNLWKTLILLIIIQIMS